ncbi:MAG: hypothetical protein CL678_06135 [Bdellovibrionaceae bacterium]|nr:hypothetical protein [Pseudobdellovibrionaceae bacterium]
MAFCRYNYDECRTKKKLQESTGPGRWILNMPGNGPDPCFFNDPHIRLQQWGANLDYVVNGAPIDIDSDLTGRTRRLTKYCSKEMFSEKGVPVTEKIIYPICNEALTDQSRTTHPAFKYRDLPQTREYPLFLNPQENLCFKFHNNLNTRLLERDNYIPKIPCLKKKKYILTK